MAARYYQRDAGRFEEPADTAPVHT
jgi:hypothetical protein